MAIKQIFRLFTKMSKVETDLAGGGGVSRCMRSRVEVPEYLVRNIKTVSDKGVRKALTDCVSLFSADKMLMAARNSKNNMTLLDELVLKMQICDDPNAKAQIEKLILATKDQSEGKVASLLLQANELLDTVNVAGGKYSNLFKGNRLVNSDVRKAANQLKRQHKILEGINPEYAKEFIRELDSTDFQKYSRLSGVKSYIEANPKDKEMANYLWEKYFLSTLDSETAKQLRKIDNDFGVKVFFEGNVSEAKLYWLNEEFAMQKSLSGGTAEFPTIYDVTKYDPNFAESASEAYFIRAKNKIAVRGVRQIERTTRHEQLHANDKSLDTGSVMKFTKEEKTELNNAGVDMRDILYGETNIMEARAVFVSANMDKISAGFKNKMISNGVPEYFTRMGQVSCRDYLNNKLFLVKNHEKILSDLETRLGGKISTEVAEMFAHNPNIVEVIPDILKNCKYNVIEDYTFIKLFKEEVQKCARLERVTANA